MSSPNKIGIVIDTGSFLTKAGFSSEAFPRCLIPTAIGRLRGLTILDGFPDFCFGREAIQKRGLCELTWPVKNGMIDNWDDMEKLWHHIFYRELHIAPEESQLLIAIHPLTQRRDKEKMAEILFETFMVRDLYLAHSPALTLYASGRTTGVVWENGHSCSYASPVFEGFTLKHATLYFQITGHILTEYLQKLLSDIGYSFTTPAEISILENIKEKMCHVVGNYNTESALKETNKEKLRYELPDGQQIFVPMKHCFQCPELLFKPSLLQFKYPNTVDVICSSISKCDIDYKKVFYNNVVISGGSTMFPGLPERLNVELKKHIIDMPDITTSVEAMPSRQIAPWAGGSIFSSLSAFKGLWMSREEYEDAGVDRVNYKFY